jgi:hypothetical protein
LRQNKLGNIIEDGNILSILVTVYEEDTPILNEVVFFRQNPERPPFWIFPAIPEA